MATGLLVVDVQPAYASYCDAIARKVAQRINNTVKPVSIMWVGDGLTEDSEESVREYLHEHGARPGRLAQANFIEKDYAYLRGFMDYGVADDVIIKIGAHMLKHGLLTSDDVDMVALFEGDVPDIPQIDRIHLPSFKSDRLLSLAALETCGGGGAECLREVELWLQMVNMPFKRLDSLVYGG